MDLNLSPNFSWVKRYKREAVCYFNVLYFTCISVLFAKMHYESMKYLVCI